MSLPRDPLQARLGKCRGSGSGVVARAGGVGLGVVLGSQNSGWCFLVRSHHTVVVDKSRTSCLFQVPPPIVFLLCPWIPRRVAEGCDVAGVPCPLSRLPGLLLKLCHGAFVGALARFSRQAANSFPDFRLSTQAGYRGDSNALPWPGAGGLGGLESFGGDRGPAADRVSPPRSEWVRNVGSGERQQLTATGMHCRVCAWVWLASHGPTRPWCLCRVESCCKKKKGIKKGESFVMEMSKEYATTRSCQQRQRPKKVLRGREVAYRLQTRCPKKSRKSCRRVRRSSDRGSLIHCLHLQLAANHPSTKASELSPMRTSAPKPSPAKTYRKT